MVLTGSLMLSFNQVRKGDLILIVVQIALPLIGLLIRRYLEIISKGLILISIPLAFITIKSVLNDTSNSLSNQSLFIFGNNLGLIEIILVSNIQSILFKSALASCLLVIKLVIAGEGYFREINNLIVVLAIMIFLFSSFIYQEILSRKKFKLNYESQEKLKKFQSLLSKDFPVGVLIMTADFCSVLYSNMFFKNHFMYEEDQVQNSKIIDSIFKDFELEIDSSSFQIDQPDCQYISLSTFVRYLSKNQIQLPEHDFLTLPAIYRNTSNTMAFHYEIKIRKITWDQISSYTLIFNDVSERQMVTALKLADQHKDRIIATISHELRTPINGTVGLLEMISARVTDEVSRTYLTYCKNCSKLLLYLVNSILDLCQLKDGFLTAMKTSFSLEELLDEIKSLYLYQCQAKGIELAIEIKESLPREIYTDRHRLTEVLINLIGNAIKFTFHGSVILRLALDEDVNKLKFSVVDTGIGIREEDKSKLFKRFGKIQQTDTSINAQGVGLGLTIVQELLSVLNDGDRYEKVVFSSVQGVGSTFSFRILFQEEQMKSQLSISKDSAQNSLHQRTSMFLNEFDRRDENIQERLKKYELPFLFIKKDTIAHTIIDLDAPINQMTINMNESRNANSGDGNDETSTQLRDILIVDDNPFNILAASFIFEKLGCKIDKAFNGQECVDILELHHKQGKYYDLILMDIQMPVLDGPEATKIISNKIALGELRNMPIIALTARQVTNEDRSYYKSCGMVEVLEKPLNEAKILKSIKIHINN